VVTQASGEGQSVYGFTGEQQDVASGMVYLRSRYYNVYLNQFIQPDTIVPDPRTPADWNRYAYTRNNPVNYVDPSGYIAEKESKRAEFLLEKLNNVFNIQIKKDWGYLNDLFYVDPSIRTWSDCQWVEGNWRDIKELELTFEAIKDMAKVLGTQGLFRTAMRWQPVRVYRLSTDYVYDPDPHGAYSINNVMLPNDVFGILIGDDKWAKGQIVHELAHVIDYRQWWPPFRLSGGMVTLTKSFKEVCHPNPRGVKACDLVYDQVGQIEPPPTGYAQGNPREDWAESFKFFVYPSFGYLGPIRKGYIESFIKDLKTP
jgi:RHS repeat-associated protein